VTHRGAGQEQLSKVVFGPFELNAQAHEIRKSGVRVRLAGQAFQILLVLLETPGETVSRERLRVRIWQDGTFVDFEHGLNAAINKLRRALGDSAEFPRYIETIPGVGYRFVGVIPQAPAAVPPAPPPRKRWWPIAAGMVACAAVGLLLLLPRAHQPSGLPPLKLTKITTGDGLSERPAISPDGKLIAYASDGGEDRGEDLYVKAATGGKPVRLTFDGEHNTAPDFSSDGSRIVFQSSRDGGGIFEIPSLGGQTRMIVRDGRSPHFSPDGSQIAYWTGAASVADAVAGTSLPYLKCLYTC